MHVIGMSVAGIALQYLYKGACQHLHCVYIKITDLFMCTNVNGRNRSEET